MKAAVHRVYGPPEVVRVEDVPTPTPRDDEILVRVRAASVNLGDWELLTAKPLYITIIARLLAPRPRVRLPARDDDPRFPYRPKYPILGCDVAGTVEAVGSKVTRVGPGDAVFGDCGVAGFGGFAEYVCVPDRAVLVPKPATMSFEQAAALPQATFIALQALRDKARVGEGDRVLINGGGGGAGTLAIRYAKSRGARVTAVDSGAKLELMRSVGADEVLDYTKDDFTRTGDRWDAILDLAAHRPLSHCRRALTPDGIYLVAGGSWSPTWRSAVLGPLLPRRGGGRVRILLADWKAGDLEEAARMFEAGTYVPVIDRTYPLDRTGEAIGRVGAGEGMGKVVVVP